MAVLKTVNLEKVNGKIIGNAMDRLEEAGNVIAAKARANVRVGTLSRPVYRTGKYAGKFWTARTAGELKTTIRVVRKYGDPTHNVWVIAGNKKVYYAQIVEFNWPFMRPALRAARNAIKSV